MWSKINAYSVSQSLKHGAETETQRALKSWKKNKKWDSSVISSRASTTAKINFYN